MTTVVVVVAHESKDSLIKSCAVFLRMDVNVIIFNCSPKYFNPDVVLCPASTVHTDPHLRVLRTAIFPFLTSKLAALVRVNNLRRSVPCNGTFEHLNAVRRIQRVMQAPAHDKPTVNVYDGRQVYEPFRHRDICDINTPSLIPVVSLQPSKQIRHNVHGRSGNAQVLLRIEGLDAH